MAVTGGLVVRNQRAKKLREQRTQVCSVNRSQGATRLLRRRIVTAGASRQAKNPRDYASMDDLRAQLHKSGGWGIAPLLNWLSENAFGYASQVPRGLGILQLSKRKKEVSEQVPAVEPAHMEQLKLVMLCSESRAKKLLNTYPEVARMSIRELVQRLVGLKMALPAVDVARLVEMQPRLFLGGCRVDTERRVRACASALRVGLPGADVDGMVAEDPGILFVDVEPGIQQLHSLWEPDEAALANSKPAELALAVRALADALPDKWGM